MYDCYFVEGPFHLVLTIRRYIFSYRMTYAKILNLFLLVLTLDFQIKWDSQIQRKKLSCYIWTILIIWQHKHFQPLLLLNYIICKIYFDEVYCILFNCILASYHIYDTYFCVTATEAVMYINKLMCPFLCENVVSPICLWTWKLLARHTCQLGRLTLLFCHTHLPPTGASATSQVKIAK